MYLNKSENDKSDGNEKMESMIQSDDTCHVAILTPDTKPHPNSNEGPSIPGTERATFNRADKYTGVKCNVKRQVTLRSATRELGITKTNPLITMWLILSSLFVQTLACTQGQYWYEANSCIDCPINTFCNDPTGCTPSCTACAQGKTTTFTSATACTDSSTTVCPEGSGVVVSDPNLVEVSVQQGCYRCAGQINLYNVPDFVAMTSNPGDSLWCDCGPGKFYFTTNFGLQSQNTQCISCNSNSYCPSTHAERIAVGGCQQSCPTCPAGKSITFAATFADTHLKVSCTDSSTLTCPAGTGKLPDSEGCTMCPITSYNNGDRLYCKCKAYGNALSSTNTCISCPPNTYCGSNDACAGECETCPADTESGVKAAMCTSATTTACPFQTGTISGKPGCFECDDDKYNDGTGLTCQSCPANTAKDATASAQGPFCVCSEGYTQTAASPTPVCSACEVGKTKPLIGNGACKLCATGSYASDTTTCTPCPSGRYANSELASTPDQACTKCAVGKYTTGNTDGLKSSVSCIDCPVGKTSAEGSSDVSSCGCPAGMELIENLCIACPVGKYKSTIGSLPCWPCFLGTVTDTTGSTSCRTLPLGYYSTNGVQVQQCPLTSAIKPSDYPDVNEIQEDPFYFRTIDLEKGVVCQACLYPMQSNCRSTQTARYHADLRNFQGPLVNTLYTLERCDPCTLACLNANNDALIAVVVVMAVGFFGLFFFMYEKGGSVQWRQVLGVMGYLAIPVMDTYTDMIFILTNEFVSKGLLISSILAFCLPNLMLLHLLYKRNALWPAIAISKPTCLDFGDVANIYIAAPSCILLSPIMFLNACTCLFKLLVGMFLFATKSLCIGNVANWWFKWWTGNDDHEMDEAIDTEILNESLYIEIVCETLPQVFIQLYNNYKLDPNIAEWSAVSQFSLMLSFMNTLNGVYQFVYFKFVKHKKITDLSVNVSVLGIQLLDAPATNHELTMERNINRREAALALLKPSDNLVERGESSSVTAAPASSSCGMDESTSVEMISVHGKNISSSELQGLLSDHDNKVQSLLSEHDNKVQSLLSDHDNRAQQREDALFNKLLVKIKALLASSGESLFEKETPKQDTWGDAGNEKEQETEQDEK